MYVSIRLMSTPRTFKCLVAPECLVNEATLVTGFGGIRLVHLDDLTPRKELCLGGERLAKGEVRPTAHLAHGLGVYLAVAPLDHARGLENRDQDGPKVFTEPKGELVVAFLDLVLDALQLSVIGAPARSRIATFLIDS